MQCKALTTVESERQEYAGINAHVCGWGCVGILLGNVCEGESITQALVSGRGIGESKKVTLEFHCATFKSNSRLACDNKY